jgi:hypothetical protein
MFLGLTSVCSRDRGADALPNVANKNVVQTAEKPPDVLPNEANGGEPAPDSLSKQPLRPMRSAAFCVGLLALGGVATLAWSGFLLWILSEAIRRLFG